MNGSIWHMDASIPLFPSLDGNHHTDVLIVGGGLTGLLCGYFLQAEGVNYILIESGRLMSGTSGDTTAKITSQHGGIYHKLLHIHGSEKARAYWEMNQAALRHYDELCSQFCCDYLTCDHAIFTTDNLQLLSDEMKALEVLKIPALYEEISELPFSVQGAIRFRNQAKFHPIKFAAELSAGLNIYEHTKAVDFFPGGVRTNRGEIKASKIIVATHFPVLNKHGSYFLKLYQSRSYVRALSGIPKLSTMYLDIQENGISFRNYGDLLLIGGGGHRTGKQGGGWRELERVSKRFYPESREVCRWATQDCMPLDSMPYVGRYGNGASELFVATGFQKWGMTSAMASAMILRDMVLGRENPYADLLRPNRSILHMQLLKNMGESVFNLFTPTKPRCPHLGCALKWNPEEHSWDCPCHGSRFTEEGKLLDGPATDNKKL